MYDVLAAIDADESRALAQADAMAELPDAPDAVRVFLMHVFEENPEGGSVHQVGAIRRAADRLEEAGIAYEFRESSGDPATEIIREAEALEADLVSVSGRQQTPTGKAIFGSVTQSLLLEADRPILVVGADS